MTFYYCRPCYLHDRATVRLSEEAPTTPCPHFGTEPANCKRMEWVTRSFFCLSCSVIQKTTIVYHPHHPADGEVACPEFSRHRTWVETEESRWIRKVAGMAA
jgi:hypothetical protein